MKVWLVNPFDPLFGEHEQLGRYACLAETLQQAGNDVLWWSSTFSHRFKRNVDAERVHAGFAEKGIRVRLVPTPPYAKNVSYRRLKSHRAYGRAFRELASDQPHPDVILASSPPLESAYEAARLGREWQVPTIIDIQDQWPDNFARVMPGAMRWMRGVLLAPYYTLERKAYTLADGIIGVAQGYLDRGVLVGGRKKHEGVFPLGVDLQEVDKAIAAGAAEYTDKWRKPEGRIRLLYSGSLSHNYDFQTIIRAAALAKQRFADRVEFVLSGTGELALEAERLVIQHDLDNVHLTGFLGFDEWAYLLSQADAGFNASFPDAMIYFPNKIFYYLAAGAAVLNTIPGQCAELVEKEACGLNYTAGDPESCFDAIAQLVDAPQMLTQMGLASRRLAEQVYDRKIILTGLTRFLEEAADATSGAS
ncbi:MAG: glycosyltransferase family 4 protein [Phycisphaerales bacterium]|nr:MAG: glycosyltransferase family 4 protein [Phycisphaerales bacterium]